MALSLNQLNNCSIELGTPLHACCSTRAVGTAPIVLQIFPSPFRFMLLHVVLHLIACVPPLCIILFIFSLLLSLLSDSPAKLQHFSHRVGTFTSPFLYALLFLLIMRPICFLDSRNTSAVTRLGARYIRRKDWWYTIRMIPSWSC